MNVKLFFVSVLTTFNLLACASKNNDKKPNVIFILADDLGYGDVSCYGQVKFNTPNIDKLAHQGLKFTQCYSGCTVCAPSRSTLITGQHTGHTEIRGNKSTNKGGGIPLSEEANSLAQLFKEQGYVTGAFGKWGLGYPHSTGDPIAKGFDTFFGYNCQAHAHYYYPEYLIKDNDKYYLNKNKNGARVQHSAVEIQKKALDFIDKNKDQPFFLFYPTTLPHAELSIPEEYLKKYRGKFLPEKKHENKIEDPANYKGYYPQPEGHAAFAGIINLLDDQIGEVVKKIEDLGLDENTIIIFCSDNGPHAAGGADPNYFNSSGGLRGKKRDLYEGGIRVPLIIKWPLKIAPNRTTDQICAFWDFYATFGDIFNVPVNNYDGITMLPTWLNKDQQKDHEYLYWEFHENGGAKAIRKGKWKAVRRNINKNQETKTELYNLETDWQEKNDVATKYPKIIEEMNSLMKNARTCSPIFKFKDE